MARLKLGGSLFIRDGIRLGYCFEEAIMSLVALCDRVAVLDCGSGDGTMERLLALGERYPEVLCVHGGGDWDCAKDFTKLAMLANTAMDLLGDGVDWHFMLQADEVIHEGCFWRIRELMELGEERGSTGFAVRRLNLFGDPGHFIRLDLPAAGKPCSDMPFRLGRRGVRASSDGESFQPNGIDRGYVDEVTIFHYGFVRPAVVNLAKAIEMQGWFHGPGLGESRVDGRLLEMRDSGAGWDPWRIIPRENVAAIPAMGHPVFAGGLVHEWARDEG